MKKLITLFAISVLSFNASANLFDDRPVETIDTLKQCVDAQAGNGTWDEYAILATALVDEEILRSCICETMKLESGQFNLYEGANPFTCK